MKFDCSFDQSCAELAEVYNVSVESSTNSSVQTDIAELKRLKAELLKAQQQLGKQEKIIADKDKKIKEQESTITLQKEQIEEQQASLSRLTTFQEEAFQLFKKYQ